jgi:uncharacterized lipoprotein YajG
MMRLSNFRVFLAFLIAGWLLVGCVSPSDLEKNSPSFSLSTSKDPERYALCVFPKWQDARSEAVISETENGYRLVISAMQMTDELLEVKKTSYGSSVVFYQRVAWMPGIGRSAIEAAVKACL